MPREKVINGTVTKVKQNVSPTAYYVELTNGFELSLNHDRIKPLPVDPLGIGTKLEIAHRNYKIIWAKKLLTKRQEENFSDILNQIDAALKTDQYKFAEDLFKKIQDIYPRDEFDQLVCKYQIPYALQNYDFLEASRLFYLSTEFPVEKYHELTRKYLVEYFLDKFKINVSAEQSLTLSVDVQNQLVTARAGSGKTRILACKTALLVDRYKTNPDQILILAFTNKAATEIGNRIQREFGFESFESARTFHGLAYQLVQPQEKILFDPKGDFSKKEFSRFVQKVLRAIWNPAFNKKMYELFRKEMTSIKHAGSLLNDADYLAYIRNRRDISLGNDRVKSRGEKYIADFLFEHDISYAYERIEFWSGHNYRPDFYLHNQQKDFVIEFWGIDENNPNSEPPNWWDTSRERYCAEIREKRAYWQDKNIPLIELSVSDLHGDRERFELILKSRLQEAGIVCKKMSQEECEKKLERQQSDRLTRLFSQFIQKAKKRIWPAEEVRNKISSYQTEDERTAVFLDLACRVYLEYEAELQKENAMDFDDLLYRAIRMIEESNGKCDIGLGLRKDRRVKMVDLKWIMIDEYQDFSQLFFNLVAAICNNNSETQLMCVGDDWQAINSFAGSDLHFFHDFKALIPNSEIGHLLTNFRSQKAIVENGNKLMKDLGMPGKPLGKNRGGSVEVQHIDDIWIESRTGEPYVDERKSDSRFVFYERRADGEKVNDNGFLQAKYLKACYQIITVPDNLEIVARSNHRHKDKISVVILSRTNRLYRITCDEFINKLYACFTTEELQKIGNVRQKVRISTVHGFKGLEADIVIILRACEGAFPLIHPDNSLFEIFGQTEKDALDEERRLFYVAITRAKSSLYILTERTRESEYLKYLSAYESVPSGFTQPALQSNGTPPQNQFNPEDIPF